jgi:citrate synthase
VSDDWLHTEIGSSTPTSITVRGRDLTSEVMGSMSFSELAFLLASGRAPSKEETNLFDAILDSLADHGLTPTALAARLTYTGAPESIQGAIAAGLLGGGSVFLGPVEDTARFLDEILQDLPGGELTDEVLEVAATEAVQRELDAGRRVPGLGHPIHSETDPRTPRLYQLADETKLTGPHLRLLAFVATAYRAHSGKSLPINGAGTAGAALADLGFPPHLVRGFALLARTAGLIGHLAEEADKPIGMRLWKDINQRATEGDA